jgi:hypothetical protein
LDILKGEDEEKRQFVLSNLHRAKLSCGKNKKTFADCDNKYINWICREAFVDSSTLELLKIYSERKNTKFVKNITNMKKGTSKVFKKDYMRATQEFYFFCRFCNERVEVKETFHGDVCLVCGFQI